MGHKTWLVLRYINGKAVVIHKKLVCIVQSNRQMKEKWGTKAGFFCFDVVSSQYKLNYALFLLAAAVACHICISFFFFSEFG